MSADDSITQFKEFCDSHDCETCEYLRFKDRGERYACAIAWMEKNAVSANDETELKPCPFCGGKADVTDFGVTSFIIEPDGGIVGDISCAGCAASVTCAGGEDERCHESDFGCKRLHPMDLWRVAEATKEKWNRRAAQ